VSGGAARENLGRARLRNSGADNDAIDPLALLSKINKRPYHIIQYASASFRGPSTCISGVQSPATLSCSLSAALLNKRCALRVSMPWLSRSSSALFSPNRNPASRHTSCTLSPVSRRPVVAQVICNLMVPLRFCVSTPPGTDDGYSKAADGLDAAV
jgi:hypothetical protein